VGLIGLEPKWQLNTAVFESLVTIAGRLAATTETKQEEMKATVSTYWEVTNVWLEKMEAYLEKLKAEMDANWGKMKACHKAMETYLENREVN
jgi:hypothetical protein